MCRKIIFTGVLTISLILISGMSLWAQKLIDTLEYPPLREPDMPEIETVTLDNGMILYLIDKNMESCVTLSS